MEQTEKYSSSGSRSNSLALLLLLVSLFATGQDVETVRGQTLSSRFPVAMLKAQQENSLEKIGDFYYYLNLLSASSDNALQEQLKENIYGLFADKNTLVEDFTTGKPDRIPLTYLLDNVASRRMSFSVKNESVSKHFYSDYWIDSYDLEVAQEGIVSLRQVRHVIYFRPEDKNYGSRAKTVMGVALGGLE